MPLFSMKIKHKLPLLAILLSVVPVLFLSVVMLHVSRETSLRSYRMILSDQAQASAQHLSSLYIAQKNGLVYASRLEIYRKYLTALRAGDTASGAALRESVEDLQRVAVATDESINRIILTDINARVVACSDGNCIGTSMADYPAYYQAVARHSDAYQMLSTKRGKAVLLGYPVTDNDGRMLGVILRELSLTDIKDYVTDLRIGQSGYLFVLDRGAEPLTNTAAIHDALDRALQTNDTLRALARDTQNGTVSTRDPFMRYSLGGQATVAACSVVPAIGWVTVAAVPENEINHSSTVATRIFLLTALCTGLVSLGSALWLVRTITAPLGTLIENINIVADGQLDHTVEERRRDEFAQVYDAVNLMARRLSMSYSQLSAAARTDVLTGLANRKAVYEIMERDFSAHSAAFMLDLDGFKEVNDCYGHDSGDGVLIAVAEVLRTLEYPGACAARLGGDEFFVFFAQYDNALSVVSTAYKLCEDICTICAVNDCEIMISASIGIAFAVAEDTSYQRLLKKADLAMYEVKKSGKSGVYVYPDAPKKLQE